MKAWNLCSSAWQNQETVNRAVGASIATGAKGVLILLSCLWVFGCSTPAETRPEPTKEETRSDADRFFEKLEQEKRGE